MTVDCPAEIAWPRWVPAIVAAVSTALAGTNLIVEGYTEVRLILSLVVAGILWLDVFRPQIRLVVALTVILAATAASARGDSVMLFVVVLACAEAASTGGFVIGIIALAAAIATAMLRAAIGSGTISDYIAWPLGFSCACFGALVVRSQLLLTAQLRATAATLATEAALDERRRLAREIHDVIAHSMTVTMLHVTGARLALQDEPPDVAEAIEALEEAEHQGRQSLADIRQTVGLLNTVDDATPRDESPFAPPVPGASEIDDLVASFRDAGVPVEFRVQGSLTCLSPTTGLATFRILQESLANAAKHAPGAEVSVDIHVGRRRVEVQVTNGPSLTGTSTLVPAGLPGGGRGTMGMAERARQLGGRFEARPRGDGWRVCAALPVYALDPSAMPL